MKKVLIGLLTLVVSTLSGSAQQSGVFPFQYKKVELENGFKAYLIKAGAPGQIAYVTVVRTGSREEWEPGRSGFAHFFEHVMFRGTEKYPHYDRILTEIGADNNAFTGDDQTVYYVVAASDSLEQLVDLESDRFMNLKYDEAAFRTEAGAVLGEFSQGRANPFLYLFENIRETAFDKHTYKHLTIGFEDDVRAMPEGYEYSKSFFNRYYRPENCVLLLAGDIEFDSAEALIRQYYSPWKPGYTAPEIESEPEQREPRESETAFPGRTLPILAVNYKGPAWSATDRLAAATEVLGQVAFGSNSDIYRKLVIQDQKVQTFFADFEAPRDPGLLSIIAMVINPDDVSLVSQEIEKTVQRFREETCDEETLERTKRAIKYSFLMGLETAQNAAFSLLNIVVNTGGLEAVEDYYRTLDAVTPEDIREAARAFLKPEGRTTVTLKAAGGAR